MKTFIEDFLSKSERLPYPKSTPRSPGSLIGKIGEATIFIDVGDEIYLAGLHVSKHCTGHGHGSKALHWLCRLADKHSFKIYLRVKSTHHKALSDIELQKWYRRYGFKLRSSWMTRYPKQRGE